MRGVDSCKKVSRARRCHFYVYMVGTCCASCVHAWCIQCARRYHVYTIMCSARFARGTFTSSGGPPASRPKSRQRQSRSGVLSAAMMMVMICIPVREASPHQDSAGTAPTVTQRRRRHSRPAYHYRINTETGNTISQRLLRRVYMSIKSSQSRTRAQSHTRARRSRSQGHLKGSNPRVAKRRRLGGLNKVVCVYASCQAVPFYLYVLHLLSYSARGTLTSGGGPHASRPSRAIEAVDKSFPAVPLLLCAWCMV